MSIVWFLVLVGPLIFVHELGHFLVAKALKVKVLKFSLGFGPRLVGFTRGDTEYVISAVPLGGYVKMEGEQPGDEVAPADRDRSYLHQAPWKRALISAAGPFASLAFPVLVYFFVFVGAHQEISSRVGTVEPGLPAAAAGIHPGDRIIAVDGEPVRTFEEVRKALEPTHGREVALRVERGEQVLVKRLVPETSTETNPIETSKRGLIGITPYLRPAVIGVPAGSAAEAAGLRSFDRIVSVDGRPTPDEATLARELAGAQGTLQLEVERLAEGAKWPEPKALAEGAKPELTRATISVERQPGEGYAALGVERSDLYVADVVPESPVAKAGVRPGDRLLAVDGKPLASITRLRMVLDTQGEKPFALSWRSGSEERTATLAQKHIERSDTFGNVHKILDTGLRTRATPPGQVEEPEEITVRIGVGEAIERSFLIVPEIAGKMVLGLAALFTMDDGHKQVGSVLLIADLAQKSADAGLDAFLTMMALISINLGVINLLPIPILDGFNLLSALWEQIRRRPIPMRAREVANMVGLAMLVLIMGMALFNDVQRKLAQRANASGEGADQEQVQP